MITAGPLDSFEKERARRIAARIEQGAGALDSFQRFLDDALTGDRHAAVSAALCLTSAPLGHIEVIA